ncbi:MAG: hypothetical protein JWL83_1444 [Actinomycetia bacterium]|nr:hypothetical protein [Actinomycetes bacterium]
MPLADDAVIAVRAHDTFTSHTPELGMPTTLRTGSGERAFHPGPLEFWGLALPERAFGLRPVGMLVGVAGVNIAAIVAAALIVRRRAGTVAAVGALAVLAWLAWSLGRSVVASPWNPHILLLPLACTFLAVWGAANGDTAALIVAIVSGSFVAQAHALYLVFVGVLVAFGAVAFILARRQSRAPLRTPLLAAGVAGVALWSGPIVDQLTHRPGNLVLLERAARHQDPAIGWGGAITILVRAIGAPPFWAHGIANDAFVRRRGHGIAVLSVLGVAVLFALLVGGLAWAVLRRDGVVGGLVATALVALALALFTLARVPDQFPEPPRYRFLMVWPLGALLWFAAALVIVRVLHIPRDTLAIGALALMALIVASAGRVAGGGNVSIENPRDIATVRHLSAAVVPKLQHRVYVVESTGATTFLTMRFGLLAELRRRGVDARVEPGDFYLSPWHAGNVRTDPVLVVADEAGYHPPTGATRLASYTPPRPPKPVDAATGVHFAVYLVPPPS